LEAGLVKKEREVSEEDGEQGRKWADVGAVWDEFVGDGVAEQRGGQEGAEDDDGDGIEWADDADDGARYRFRGATTIVATPSTFKYEEGPMGEKPRYLENGAALLPTQAVGPNTNPGSNKQEQARHSSLSPGSLSETSPIGRVAGTPPVASDAITSSPDQMRGRSHSISNTTRYLRGLRGLTILFKRD
jgi:hypothetical protein